MGAEVEALRAQMEGLQREAEEARGAQAAARQERQQATDDKSKVGGWGCCCRTVPGQSLSWRFVSVTFELTIGLIKIVPKCTTDCVRPTHIAYLSSCHIELVNWY